MSCSKPLAPFVCDALYYLNRDQLERFSIICRRLKNFIERYFHSRPYRVFEELYIIGGGSYGLFHNGAYWHPNRDDYSLQQFLDGQKCSIDESRVFGDPYTYHSFAEMRPYWVPTVRIAVTHIDTAAEMTYNPEYIAEMESITYLWRDYHIYIFNGDDHNSISAEDFLPILNSPTILQCRNLEMFDAHFSFKDYAVLYSTKFFQIECCTNDENDPNYWQQFLEQPGVKPIVILQKAYPEIIDNLFDRLSKAFSSATVPNAFKVVFAQVDEPLTASRETNKTSGEILELKKGLPVEYEEECLEESDPDESDSNESDFDEFKLGEFDNYTLERSKI
ncbi:hypothetical protein Ddc_09811 [Ditylenchus destructor]|nr:hypothetical protein Ddc_09811 [Ditylenchus destructor]